LLELTGNVGVDRDDTEIGKLEEKRIDKNIERSKDHAVFNAESEARRIEKEKKDARAAKLAERMSKMGVTDHSARFD